MVYRVGFMVPWGGFMVREGEFTVREGLSMAICVQECDAMRCDAIRRVQDVFHHAIFTKLSRKSVSYAILVKLS
jgi:hypothetical protein